MAELGRARPDVGWRRSRRRNDQPFGQRRGELGHTAELKDVEILVGIEAVFLHEITQGKIRRRAEASDADCFPFKSATFLISGRAIM